MTGAVLLTATLLFPGWASAQLTPSEAAAALGRGINLGNTLEPPTEGGWNNPVAEEYYFDDYRTQGFSTVRIPVRWDEHTEDASPFRVDGAWMNRVEQLVDWALERDLYVILNAHHEDWLKVDYGNPLLQARFDSIWVQIAERFREHSDRLLFEIINEPKGLTQQEIDELNLRVLGLIRQSNPTRIVIIGGHEWSNFEQLQSMAVPDDDYLMGYYHSYDPWEFAGLGNGTWGTDADKAALRARLQGAKAWSENTGVPVMVSEWGAIHDADFNSRMRFYSTYVEEAVAAGIPFMVWDDGGMFRVYERQTRRWPEVKDVLISAYPDGPTKLTLGLENDTYVRLDWTNRADFGGDIQIQRRSGTWAFTTIATVSSTTRQYLDADLEEDTRYEYRLVALNQQGGDRYSETVRIQVPGLSRYPYPGVPHRIPGAIEAEDFDEGGEGLTFHDSDGTNSGNANYRLEAVDIAIRQGGGYLVTDVANGEWLEYTIDVPGAGAYEVEVHAASIEGGGILRLAFNGVNGPVLVMPETGGAATTDVASATVHLQAGVQIMRATVVLVRPFHIDRFTFQPASSTAVEDEPAVDGFDVYPNPVIDMARLRGAAITSYELVDVVGRVVATGGGTHQDIDMSALAPGLYIVRVETAGGPDQRLVVKR